MTTISPTELSHNELQGWFQIACFLKFGPATITRLMNAMSASEVLEASAKRLEALGINGQIACEFISARQEDQWKRQYEQLEKEEIQMMLKDDPRYPELLKHIHQPPAVLFWKGTIELEWSAMISVVGTRLISPYGKTVTKPLVSSIAQCGMGVVSGLALGVDGEAHLAALEGGAPTAAVLGGGVDRETIFPSQHRLLAERIQENGGCVLSEFPPLVMPLRHHFPMRNRIIAGLTRATLVIEAGEHSGALITAHNALEEGRDVFAVPGPITSLTSHGTNQLIRRGAACITTSQELMEHLELTPIQTAGRSREPRELSPSEKIIFESFQGTSADVDALIRTTRLDATAVLGSLATLELKGLVRQVAPATYIKES